MFDGIARRYDFLNHALSLGCDVAWRRRLVLRVAERPVARVLDAATGTGDVMIAVTDACPGLRLNVGLDMAGQMLALGQRKIEKRGLASQAAMMRGTATNLPFQDGSFDAVTIAFGIRNVDDVNAALGAFLRVLRPGGRAFILEFSLPGNALLRSAYLFYFRHVLPRLGGWISGDRVAYQYLNQSVEAFPYGEAFCELLRKAGFTRVSAVGFTFGVATLYQGEKPTEGERA